MDDCSPCPPGTYQSEALQTNCDNCPEGTKGTKDEARSESDGCITCEAGRYQKYPGQRDCLELICGKGKYSSSPDECTDCPPGRYKDVEGSVKCTACPVDTYLETKGKSSKADCLSCKFNYAAHTTTGKNEGVTDPITGCVCSGGDIVVSKFTNAATSNNELIFASAHGFTANTAVVYTDNCVTSITALTDGTTYYVLVGTSTSKMKLAATSGGTAITIAQGAAGNKITTATNIPGYYSISEEDRNKEIEKRKKKIGKTNRTYKLNICIECPTGANCGCKNG